MSDDHSLLAHLVRKLTPQVEDAATDALAFILNKSEACRAALVELVNHGGGRLASLKSVKTQVSPTDAERLDLVAYDNDDSKRLIIESKFWAALLSGQASGYVEHLSLDGPAMLLFVAPEARSETLWSKITRQFEEAPGPSLEPARNVGSMKVANVADTKKVVALVSWGTLLDRLELADLAMADNVRQLKGLARVEDEAEPTPLHPEDFDPRIPQRMLDFNRMVDDVVDAHGVPHRWMTTKDLRATPVWDGYVRYFKFRSEDGKRQSDAFGLYVSCNQWLKSGTTPIWLRTYHEQEQKALKGQSEIEYHQGPSGPGWIPLHLRTGVEYADVLEDVVTQIERVRDIVLPVPEATDSTELASG